MKQWNGAKQIPTDAGAVRVTTLDRTRKCFVPVTAAASRVGRRPCPSCVSDGLSGLSVKGSERRRMTHRTHSVERMTRLCWSVTSPAAASLISRGSTALCAAVTPITATAPIARPSDCGGGRLSNQPPILLSPRRLPTQNATAHVFGSLCFCVKPYYVHSLEYSRTEFAIGVSKPERVSSLCPVHPTPVISSARCCCYYCMIERLRFAPPRFTDVFLLLSFRYQADTTSRTADPSQSYLLLSSNLQPVSTQISATRYRTSPRQYRKYLFSHRLMTSETYGHR